MQGGNASAWAYVGTRADKAHTHDPIEGSPDFRASNLGTDEFNLGIQYGKLGNRLIVVQSADCALIDNLRESAFT